MRHLSRIPVLLCLVSALGAARAPRVHAQEPVAAAGAGQADRAEPSDTPPGGIPGAETPPDVAPIDGLPREALDPGLFPDEEDATSSHETPTPARLRNGYLQAGMHFALRGPPAADYGLGFGVAGGLLLGQWHRTPMLPRHQMILGGAFQWTLGLGSQVTAQYQNSSYFLLASDIGLLVRAGVGARRHGYLGIAWMPSVGIRFGSLETPLPGSSSLRQTEVDFHPVGLHMMGGARRGAMSFGTGFRLLIRGTWDAVFQLDLLDVSWGL